MKPGRQAKFRREERRDSSVTVAEKEKTNEARAESHKGRVREYFYRKYAEGKETVAERRRL